VSVLLKSAFANYEKIVDSIDWQSHEVKFVFDPNYNEKGVSSYLKNLILQYYFHFIYLQETMILVCEDITSSIYHKQDVGFTRSI